MRTSHLAGALALGALTLGLLGCSGGEGSDTGSLKDRLEDFDETMSEIEPTIEAKMEEKAGGAIEATFAFEHVAVVPMDDERLLEDHTVLVDGDRIVALGPSGEIEIAEGVTVIDGEGAYLMPGLADMHAHLATRDGDPGSLVLYLAEGVTTVRSMSGPPENARWRDEVDAGQIAGPRILTSGQTIVGGLSPELRELALSLGAYALPETEEEAAEEARRQAEAGWPDLVKVYDGLSDAQYLAAIAAANEAGIYVAGHALDALSLEAVLSSGIDEIAHVDELNLAHWIGFPGEPDFALDYDAIPATAAMMRQNDVNIVSNLVADEVVADLIFDPETVLARDEYRVVRPETMAQWRTEGRHLGPFAEQGPYRRDMELPFFLALVKGLQDAGVVITIGTDTSGLVEGSVPSGIHRELELLVEAGLSSYEALVAGTVNAGRIVERMGRDGSFGTIEAGRRADLLLLDGDPLENVSHTRSRLGVMAGGRWYPQAELDQRVEDFVATYEPAP